jgi:hypothetical protein
MSKNNKKAAIVRLETVTKEENSGNDERYVIGMARI